MIDQVLAGLRRNRFLIVGRVGMDAFAHPPGTSIEEVEMLQVDIGGSAANIAVGIVRLGGMAALVTRVSDDAIGRYCVAKLKKYGVDTSHVRSVSGVGASECRNSLAIYESRIAGHQSIIYRNGAADFELNFADVEAIDLSAYGAVIATGTALTVEPSRGAAFRIFERAKNASIPVILDIDYRPYSWPSRDAASQNLERAAKCADVIIGNDEEFEFLSGLHEGGLNTARHLARTTAAVVVYKLGPLGAITFTDSTEFRTGIFKVDALKPTGAGDSFMAGFVSALASGCTLEDAVVRGSACAAIVVAKPGCAPAMPSLSQLHHFLMSHPGPALGN